MRGLSTKTKYKRQKTLSPELNTRSANDQQENNMHVLKSNRLDESRLNVSHVSDKGIVLNRLLAVFVSSIQWFIVVSFIVTITSAGRWSVQHHWVGYAIFFMCVVACTAIIASRPSRKSYNSSLVTKTSKSIDANIAHRLQRRTGIMLLVLVGVMIISRWMYTLDSFWGQVWIEDILSLASYSAAGFLVLYCTIVLYFKRTSHYSE